MSTNMSIGEASRATGLSAQTIRRYEQMGLLPPAPRTESGYRNYRREDVVWLQYLRQARDLGFPLARLARLSRSLGTAGDSAALHREAREHLDEVRIRLADLQRIEAKLAAWVSGTDPLGPPVGMLLGGAAEHRSRSTVGHPGHGSVRYQSLPTSFSVKRREPNQP